MQYAKQGEQGRYGDVFQAQLRPKAEVRVFPARLLLSSNPANQNLNDEAGSNIGQQQGKESRQCPAYGNTAAPAPDVPSEQQGCKYAP